MKKCKKIIMIISIISLFLICPPKIDEINAESQVVYSSTLIADFFLQNLKNNRDDYDDMKIIDSITLYDAQDNENGVIFLLKGNDNDGYITVYNVSGVLEVTEFSNESKFPFNGEEKLYCFGLLSYYTKVEDKQFKNIFTSEILYFDESSVAIDYTESLSAVKARAYWHEDGYYSLFGQLPFITQQPYDTACGATAAAMVLQYYKNQKDFSALPLTGTNLRDALRSDNYVGPKNANTKSIFNGIKNYVQSINSSYKVGGNTYSSWSGEGVTTLEDSHLDMLVTQIGEYDQPAIVIVGQLAYSSDGPNPIKKTTILHALTVKQVYLTSSGTSYLSCNDPFYDSKTTVNIIWHPANDDNEYFWIYGLVTISISNY